MVADRLSIYNGALRLLGERRLADLDEDREPRHNLDDIWDDGAVAFCLAQADWTFARRTLLMKPDPDATTQFGYQNAFTKPDDWARTSGYATDPYFYNVLTSFREETGVFFSDVNEFYLSFVSTDPQYGGDFSRWPIAFTRYVQGYMAGEMVKQPKQSAADVQVIEQKLEKRFHEAVEQCAASAPPAQLPSGSWVQARMGGRGGWRP